MDVHALSTLELVKATFVSLQRFGRQEMRLFRLEIAEQMQQEGRALLLLSAAVMAAMVGLTFLSYSVALLLGKVMGPSAAAAVVGAGLLTLALIGAFLGWRLRIRKFVPLSRAMLEDPFT